MCFYTETATGKEGRQLKEGVRQRIVSNMRNFQKIENDAVLSAGMMLTKTDNRVMRLILDIVLRDSQMHYWIQEWIADSLCYESVSLTPEEVDTLRDMLRKHIKLEERAIEIARQTLTQLEGSKMSVQQALLSYLLQDEEKHHWLLEYLEGIKR